MSPPSVSLPDDDHTATMIFLHGRGGSGNGWERHLKRQLNLDYMKFVCPHAPVRAVTMAGGPATAWFDEFVKGIDQQDERGIRSAAKKIHRLIDEEIENEGIDTRRVIVGGFSQGGTLALWAALTYPKPLGAIVTLSSYVPLPDLLEHETKECQKSTPIFHGHGLKDYFVELWMAEKSRDVLSELYPNYEYHSYKNLEHDDNEEEMTDLRRFLKRHLVASK